MHGGALTSLSINHKKGRDQKGDSGMAKEAKRIGRPMKKPPRGQRVSLGLKVTAEIKRRLDSAARATGRTQSQEAERRIELSYTYERALGEYQTALARLGQMKQGQTEKILRDLGWQRVADLRWGGHIWLPPGRLEVQKTGWVDPNDHTPLAPPKLNPDPTFVDAMDAIVEAVATKLKERRGS
jgi:predicted DNA-binding protein